MGCRVSKEKTQKPDASAVSRIPKAATRFTFSAEIAGVIEVKKERDERSRRCVAKDQKEAKPELIEKNNIVSDKKHCRLSNGTSPSFGVYCRRNPSVSRGRPTNEANSGDETRETKQQMEGTSNSDKRSEAELAGKKERKGRGFISRPAGAATFLNVSWRNPFSHNHKLVEKVRQ